MSAQDRNEVVIKNDGTVETREAFKASNAETTHGAVKAVAGDVVRTSSARTNPKEESVAEGDTREVMAHTSPDGRPPDAASKSKGQLLFTVMVLIALGIGAVIIMTNVGGIVAVITGVVYVGALALAAIPVWGAGLLRKKEEVEATTEVTMASRQQRRASWSRSADRK